MNKRIIFFKTKDNKIFILNKYNKPVEIIDFSCSNKENILKIAKKFSKRSDNMMSTKCFREFNAISTFSTTQDNFLKKEFVIVKIELSTF